MFAVLRPNEALSPVPRTATTQRGIHPRTGSNPMHNLPSNPCEYKLLEQTMTQAFSSPLLGMAIISKDLKEIIHAKALNAINRATKKAKREDFGLDVSDCDIIHLCFVISLQNMGDCGDKEGARNGNKEVWKTICKSFDFPYDKTFGNSRLYKIFRYAIESSTSRHELLFVSEGNRYCTSLLAHSLAQKKMYFNIFDSIFAFYVKTLNYNYCKADPAFRAFADAMRCKLFGGRPLSSNSVYIKSARSSSAIRAMFIHMPDFMAEFVENVVCSFDNLLTEGGINEVSYLDVLVSKWFEGWSKKERANAKHERSKSAAVQDKKGLARIRAEYQLINDERVSLVIPRFTLRDECDENPSITIIRYPGDSNPYFIDTHFIKSGCYIRSAETITPLDDLISPDSEQLELRAVVTHGGKVVYDSGTRLYRDCIVFDENGREATKRPDDKYVDIFLTGGGHISVESCRYYCEQSCGNAQLHSILYDEESHITVNGKVLFHVEPEEAGLRVSLSAESENNCKYFSGDLEHAIFAKQPTIELSSENQAYSKQYRILVDGAFVPITKYRSANSNNCSIALPDGDGIHEVRIIDNSTNKRVYTLRYVVFMGFSLRFDGFFNSPNFDKNGFVEISCFDETKSYQYNLSQGQEAMLVPFGDGRLSLDVPKLRCQLNDIGLPADPGQIIWREDIPIYATLEVSCPRGYTGTIAIGNRLFEPGVVGIGNKIRVMHDAPVETVSVILSRADEPPMEIKLFDIAHEPSFAKKPLVFDGGDLLWGVEGNYIGDKGSEFEIRIFYKDEEVGRFCTCGTDEVISLGDSLCEGKYDYAISARAPGILTKPEIIMHGSFIVGGLSLLKIDAFDAAMLIIVAPAPTLRSSADGVLYSRGGRMPASGGNPLNKGPPIKPGDAACLYAGYKNLLNTNRSGAIYARPN